MKWRTFTFKGESYDLSHLHPGLCCYEQPAKGELPTRLYKVEVIFSIHCFTRGFKENETPDNALLYTDSRETRVFDFQRYVLSKRLPAIVEGLAQHKCYQTGHGNYFTIRELDDLGDVIEYDVFFTVSRSGQKVF